MAALVKFSRSWSELSCLTCSCMRSTISQRHNSNKAFITKTKRHTFTRTYPTLLIQPDGSSIMIRHERPRKILKLPIDLALLTEAEQTARVKRLSPPKKIEVREEIEDDFDVNEYSNLWKK